jgi:hypothetical protein
MGYLWSRHLLRYSMQSQDEIVKTSALESFSASYLLALLSPDQNL